MIDLLNCKVLNILPPGAIKDDASWAPAEIDAKGARSVDIIVTLGATDIAMAAFKLQESDVTSSGQTDISGGDFSVSPATLPSSTDDNNVYAIHVNMTGRKRFLTLVATAGNGSTGTYASAIAILSRLEESANSASERGFAQELFV